VHFGGGAHPCIKFATLEQGWQHISLRISGVFDHQRRLAPLFFSIWKQHKVISVMKTSDVIVSNEREAWPLVPNKPGAEHDR
jgi:hypothetical protein